MIRSRAAVIPLLVVGIAAVKCLLWSLSLPPWYGPDEPAHFAYVQLLAIRHVVPYGTAHGETVLPTEVTCSGARLGFRADGPFLTAPPWGPDQPPPCTAASGDPRVPVSNGNPAGDYLPIYYGLGVLFWDAAADQPVEVRLQAVRMLSALLGVIATAFTYLAGFWFFDRNRAAGGAAALLFAFQPMASQQFGIVTNDALLICVAAGFFWLMARGMAVGWTTRSLFVLGLVGGLGYWAKPQGAFLLGAVPLAVLLGPAIALRRDERFGWWVSKARSLLPATAGGALMLIWGLAVSTALHGRLGPHPIPAEAGPHGIRTFLNLYLDNSLHRLFALFIPGSWGNFAWLSVPIPVPVLFGVASAYVLAGIGLGVGVWRGILARSRVLAFAGAVFGIALLVILLELAYYRAYGDQILQGRSFFFLLPAMATLLVGGLTSWVPRRCLATGAAATVVLALLVNVLSLLQLWSYLYR